MTVYYSYMSHVEYIFLVDDMTAVISKKMFLSLVSSCERQLRSKQLSYGWCLRLSWNIDPVHREISQENISSYVKKQDIIKERMQKA